MLDINFLLFIPILLSFSACFVGFSSYYGFYKSPNIIHHINYLFLFVSILYVFLVVYLKNNELLYLYFPLIIGMLLLPVIGKKSSLHKYLGILCFFLALIQFFVFKYHGNTHE